jgi:hypothetical protein
MDDLLTPEEMKVAIGLTADDAMIKYAHGLSDFIVVCQAQSAKTKAALVAEGWKSPQDVASIINALTDAFKWNISGEIADARADERARIVGLFDAEEEQISEQDWTNNSMKRLDAHQRIIEGLR